MIYTIFAPRKRAYRLPPAGYRAPGYTPRMIAIAAAWRFEQLEGLARKEKRG
jgi:hypothetical protein